MMRFLIIKTSSIGDVIQSLHLIDYLQKRFPHCLIDWVVEEGIAPLLEAHPQIDRVFRVNTRLWRTSLFRHRHAIESFCRQLHKTTYDALFDLQGNTKSGLVTLVAKAQKKVGYSWGCLPEKSNFFATNVHISVDNTQNVRTYYLQLLKKYFGDEEEEEKFPPLHLKLSREEESRLTHFSHLAVQRPRLMICFGSNWRNKQLPEDTWEPFLKLINDKFSPHFFFIYGSEKEKRVATHFQQLFSFNSHAIGEMSLALWQRFMFQMEAVIALDSSALHLCATTTTPSFGLFGPSSASAYKPLGENHHAFQGACPYGNRFTKRCSILRTCKTGACLREARAEMLFDQFCQFWESTVNSSAIC